MKDPTDASPSARVKFAKKLLVWSVIMFPLTEVAIIWGPEGLADHIINAWSAGAITLTAWDILQTADVRDEQEKGAK